MKSKYSKVFFPFFGKPIVKNIYDTVKSLNPSKIVVVVSEKDYEIARETFPKDSFIAIQKKPLGTADAVKEGMKYVDKEADILILCGDTPLLKKETINNLINQFRKSKASASLLTAILKEPKQYGRITRNNSGELDKIVEYKDATCEERNINEVNSGVYIFKGKDLEKALENIGNNNKSGEFYFTDTLQFIKETGGKICAETIFGEEEIIGINSKRDLSYALKLVFNETNDRLMEEDGVIIVDPESTFIDRNVKIGRDSIIKPFTVIEGNVKIGEDTTIGPFVCIRGGSEGIEIGNNCNIGPFTSLRDGTLIEDEAKVGSFVEFKKVKFGKKSKSMHLTYLGDAEIGENVNIGAGTITCNYDGSKKNKTTIEDNVFIGSDTIIVAPLKIGKGAYTAAGSTITDDVPEDSLSIGRARQINKEGWCKKKREEKKDE
jgi:bifunctional UDP-N-acetylglucosamine pyrophosphorylase/glucosamine-1-phosphate N-acetyltransferase